MLFDAVHTVVTLPDNLFFSIAVISDEEMRKINHAYRGRDTTTDVLSFRYDLASAEILLSPSCIRAQARDGGHPIDAEASLLLVHGILHTLGWDHTRSDNDAKEMERIEKNILQQCGLPYPR